MTLIIALSAVFLVKIKAKFLSLCNTTGKSIYLGDSIKLSAGLFKTKNNFGIIFCY